MEQLLYNSEIFKNACFDGVYEKVVECVITNSMNVSSAFYEEYDGNLYQIWNPLRLSVYKGHFDIVNFLLSCPDVKIDSYDEFKRRALSIACDQNFTDIFLLLLLHGAKIPISMCCGQDLGIQINLLMRACLNGNADMVGHIIDSEKINVNECDEQGRTALHFACAKLLIADDADPYDKKISNLDLEYNCIILLLISIDADINVKTKKGETAYDVYLKKNKFVNSEVVEEFEQHINHTKIEKFPIKLFLEKLGIGHVYNEEISKLEYEHFGKDLSDTLMYSIIEEFVKSCKSLELEIELKYFEENKILQLSCFDKKHEIRYTANGKEYLTFSPKIIFEEQLHHGTTCATMYIYSFVTPPEMDWGWKVISPHIIVKNPYTFRETFVDFILKIT